MTKTSRNNNADPAFRSPTYTAVTAEATEILQNNCHTTSKCQAVFISRSITRCSGVIRAFTGAIGADDNICWQRAFESNSPTFVFQLTFVRLNILHKSALHIYTVAQGIIVFFRGTISSNCVRSASCVQQKFIGATAYSIQIDVLHYVYQVDLWQHHSHEVESSSRHLGKSNVTEKVHKCFTV